MDTQTTQVGRGVPTPERLTVLEVHPTAHLTEEQKKWPVARLVPSDTEGVALLVPVKPIVPAEVLPVVAGMLSEGRAYEAAEVFARLRAAGLSLRTELGADGVLHVTLVGA